MIFKTYEKYDKRNNTITDEIGLAGSSENWLTNKLGDKFGLQSAKKGQQAFNKAMFEKDLESQKKAVQAFASTYKTTYDDAIKRKVDVDTAAAEATSKARKEIEWANDETKRYCMNTDKATISAEDFAESSRKNYESQNKVTKGFKGLSASTKALGLNLGADLAIGLAINLISAGLSKINKELQITDSAKIETIHIFKFLFTKSYKNLFNFYSFLHVFRAKYKKIRFK